MNQGSAKKKMNPTAQQTKLLLLVRYCWQRVENGLPFSLNRTQLWFDSPALRIIYRTYAASFDFTVF